MRQLEYELSVSEAKLKLAIQALRFYATADSQNPAEGFVARDTLVKLEETPEATPQENVHPQSTGYKGYVR